jgi:hypothetical protein
MFDDDDTHGFGDQIDRANSMAELLALVAAINATEEPDGITLDRLRDWLERLTARLKELGRVVGASSVTLTVGTHITASVTYGLMPGALG